MRIVFAGSDEFAVPSLRALAQEENIIEVLTQPDKKSGRGLKISSTPVKVVAEELGLPLFQPESLKDSAAVEHLKLLSPELIVVVAYGKLLPRKVLEIPPLGCVNLHASLLPELRGAGAIAWSIIRGYQETGVTTMYLDEGMDSGDIIFQKKVKIEEQDTAGTLSQRLAQEGAGLLTHTLRHIKSGDAPRIEQDENKATYAPLLKKEDGLIDWSKPAQEINNLIRGLNSWPSAYTFLAGERIKIHRAQMVKSALRGKAGEIVEVSKDRLVVTAGKNMLSLLELQPENKRKMTIKEFLAGRKISPGLFFTKNAPECPTI